MRNSSPGAIHQPIDRIDAQKSARLDMFITAVPRRTHAERGRWMLDVLMNVKQLAEHDDERLSVEHFRARLN